MQGLILEETLRKRIDLSTWYKLFVVGQLDAVARVDDDEQPLELVHPLQMITDILNTQATLDFHQDNAVGVDHQFGDLEQCGVAFFCTFCWVV